MAMPPLALSLQFGRFSDAAELKRHRSALPRQRVARWLRHALECEGEIAVRIVDAEEGQRLNREFRQRDYATNVLTFDYTHEPIVQADLVLCAPVVAREARAQGKTLADHYAHLLVHGALHAQGWDHETSAADARAMETREIEILARLGVRDPY
ncbi:MAG: rRNA maturation RNase YbeY [Burkholderiaceae bacterium]|jgi:probable rRNA maturation factor|nr:rRNA maturation RNase YbeY [Burkholderiaceae bacterium]